MMTAPKNRPRLILVHDRESSNSAAIIGYGLVAVLDFLFGIAVGWLIWG